MYVSGKLPTYSSPNLTFCPKREVSAFGLGRGRWAVSQKHTLINPSSLLNEKSVKILPRPAYQYFSKLWSAVSSYSLQYLTIFSAQAWDFKFLEVLLFVGPQQSRSHPYFLPFSKSYQVVSTSCRVIIVSSYKTKPQIKGKACFGYNLSKSATQVQLLSVQLCTFIHH